MTRSGLIAAVLGALVASTMIVRAEEANDYPTTARSEYVYGCMKANGEVAAIDRAMRLLHRYHRVAVAV